MKPLKMKDDIMNAKDYKNILEIRESQLVSNMGIDNITTDINSYISEFNKVCDVALEHNQSTFFFQIKDMSPVCKETFLTYIKNKGWNISHGPIQNIDPANGQSIYPIDIKVSC